MSFIVVTHNVTHNVSWCMVPWSPPRHGWGHQCVPGQMHRYITSHWCSDGFRGEWEGQSVTSVPLWGRNCLHTLATWSRALSCSRRNPVHQHEGLTIALRISFWNPTVVKLPFTLTWRYSMCDPPMVDDVTGCITFTTVSPDCFTPVTCEPALICEQNRGPMAGLPILVFSHECKLSRMALRC